MTTTNTDIAPTAKTETDTTPTTQDLDVLVLGATGKTGRRVTRRLRDAGVRVRAASRSGEVTFDWTVPATWEPALTGASAVYLVPPDDPSPVRQFVADAVAAGVRRFVVLSGRGIEQVANGFGQGMAVAEAAVRESGAEWTILRPNNFFQNFDEYLWLAPLRAGRLALPIGVVPEPFIDAEDVAEAAVAALTHDGHTGRVHELSGPQGLTFAEAVATIARASGRTIHYEELTSADYRAELLAEGLPEAVADALGAQFAMHRAGHTADPGDGVRHLLGRAPAAFGPWAERIAAQGTWS
ncbi:NAD(P)H-binding protein [Streptomyces celluloflavus]|uniref:NAD(P)H-binding protein n=1 Tax=Streptomyces celluloflavus TaxID=58344 RepID=UPI0036A41871